MKKLLSILFTGLLITSFASCGNNTTTTKETNDTTAPVITYADTSDVISDNTIETDTVMDTVKNTEALQNKLTLDNIEKQMKEAGFLKGERIKMAAELIGAIEGFKYKESDIEIYSFDTNSEEYKKFENGESVDMSGFFINATAVNNGFVMIGEASEDAIALFMSIK